MNPRREPGAVRLEHGGVRPLEVRGVRVADGELRADGFSYGVFELS